MDIGRITLWRGQRTVHIREIDVSLQNISRIFKLVDSSIYLVAETGVVLLPSTTGYIGDIELGGKYEVCGDEAPLSSSSHPMTPSPPPTPNNNRFQFCGRPPALASAGRPTPQRRAFSRSISIGRVEGGMLVLDGAMLFVEFTEREATVATISEKVKQDLQTDDNIILCDGQGNRLLEGGGTNCLAFWRQNARKIVALNESAYNELMKRKKRRRSHMDDGCLDKLEELVLAADELPAITKALQDLGECARSNRINTVSLTNDQVSHTKEMFSCVICKDVMRSPVVAPCCRSLLGCHVCIEEWSRNAQHCPKCRNETVWKTHFVVSGMEEVVGIFRVTQSAAH